MLHTHCSFCKTWMCFCILKRWTTQWRQTLGEKEALEFVFRIIWTTPSLDPWVCHLLDLTARLWNWMCWYDFSCSGVTYHRSNVPQHPREANKVNRNSMSNHFAVSSDEQIETCGIYSERVLKWAKAQIQTVLAESGLLSNSEPWSETLWNNWGSYNSKLIQPVKMWWWFHSVS